jgi:hypothetical protein
MSDKIDKRVGQWFGIYWEGRRIQVCVRAIIDHPWHGQLADLYPQPDGRGPNRIVAFRLRGVARMSDEERDAELDARRASRVGFETLRPVDSSGTLAAKETAKAAMLAKQQARDSARSRMFGGKRRYESRLDGVSRG